MTTLFECWNGGTVYSDRINPPQFVFNFPPESSEVITFYQLSGRMCEVMTQCDWHLNMGGQLFDIPNFPSHEIEAFALNIKNTMGYTAMPIPFQHGNPFIGYITFPIVLWVNNYTGRADMYNPITGFNYGQQLLTPQQQFNMHMPPQNLAMSITPQGSVQGTGAKNLFQSIVTVVEGAGKIAEFLKDTGIFQDNSQSN